MTQYWKDLPANWAIELRGVSKRFRRTQALSDLNLHVPIGGVHGLLGPNGSGKTTTIRMLLGLLRADQGRMFILDHQVPHQLPAVIDRVGAVVESPHLVGNLTIQRNLEILALATGSPLSRVTEVLLEVGLGGRTDTLFKACSLGMKQRVAIAATLLKRPDILIFDEPTNGLDPAGIQEIRTTMRALAEQGRTVLVSSHLLSEIEQVANSVSIIGRGRVLAEGDLDVLLGFGQPHVVVEVEETAFAHEVLRQAGYDCELVSGRLHVTRDGAIAAQDVARVLGQADLWPSHLSLSQASLESVFLSLTEGEHLSATQGRSAA
ncbi:ATP-binding cassette domain-containing protein [Arachnia propionica]|uniref:ATP-binding cassette domain-containing protein n=1 Tax=Arachnia propionica TaxID=1750 RepID=A0A3P1T818_9ACTN|nr:ATP-binding cassette domain-containing protein [Arachnia propionica]MDO5084259.1 ATP-binding cassette domain-containing protein [Arachnia propionica]RRD04583.1 ATP-binding cassette domain-containing protein [Arachnia propionica]